MKTLKTLTPAGEYTEIDSDLLLLALYESRPSS